MKHAVIDVGSNSIRLLTCDIENDNMIFSDKTLIMTRLGKGVDSSGYLAEDRMVESIDAIKQLKGLAITFGAEEIFIMATSAVRDAVNKQDFIDRVKQNSGLVINVLSGEKEAEIGYIGVLKGLKYPTEETVVLDIGGGSTEIILGNSDTIQTSVSHNIGAVRMTDVYFDDEIHAMQKLRSFMKSYLSVRNEPFESNENRTLVGIGGTITTFGAIALGLSQYNRDLIHNFELARDQIDTINQKLSMMTISERKNVVGLDPKRADIIIAGGIILSEIMHYYHYEKIVISDYDNLEGYLYDILSNR